MTNITTFPERPLARFLRIEQHEWDDTGDPVWIVYLDGAVSPRELGTFDSNEEAQQFMDAWSPDRDLFGNFLPLPPVEDDDAF